MSKKIFKTSERSFTLLETIIALGLLVTIILEMASLQGNVMKFSEYERNMTKALWIAKGIMSQMEYKSKFYPLKDIKLEVTDGDIDPALCGNSDKEICDFKYSLSVKKWDLPITDLLLGGLGGGSKDKKDADDGDSGASDSKNPMTEMIKEQLKTYITDEPIKVLTTEVSWPEGSKRNSVILPLILTTQNTLDEQIENLNAVKEGESAGTPAAAVPCPVGQKMGPEGKCLPGLDVNPDDPDPSPTSDDDTSGGSP